MEISLDVGKNTYTDLVEYSQTEGSIFSMGQLNKELTKYHNC